MGIGKTRAQRKASIRAAFTRVVTVLIVGSAIVAAMHAYNYATTADRFMVQNVEFSGLTRVATVELEPLIDDLAGQNLLLAPLESYAQRLTLHPRVRHAQLRRVLPDKVAVTVEEREPVALVFTGEFFEVDTDGVVMSRDSFTDMLDLPIISGIAAESVQPGRRSDSDELRSALIALQACHRYGGELADDVSEIAIAKEGVVIRSLSRHQVLVLGEGDFDAKLKKYFLLKDTMSTAERDARWVDLRFQDQVVLRDQRQ